MYSCTIWRAKEGEYCDPVFNFFLLFDLILINSHCYTSQLKYVFWLEENVSRVIGQNFMTP